MRRAGLCLLLAGTAAAQVFYGSLRREGNLMWVVWSNTPPHVMVQHSPDLTNWFDMFEVKRHDGQTQWKTLEYPVTNTQGHLYMRLRAL